MGSYQYHNKKAIHQQTDATGATHPLDAHAYDTVLISADVQNLFFAFSDDEADVVVGLGENKSGKIRAGQTTPVWKGRATDIYIKAETGTTTYSVEPATEMGSK